MATEGRQPMELRSKGKRDLHPKSLVKYDFDVMTDFWNYLKAAALQDI